MTAPCLENTLALEIFFKNSSVKLAVSGCPSLITVQILLNGLSVFSSVSASEIPSKLIVVFPKSPVDVKINFLSPMVVKPS